MVPAPHRQASSRVRARLDRPRLIAFVASLAAYGCAQIIGADGDRELSPLVAGASSGGTEEAVGDVPVPGDPNACPPDQKRCNGACVPKSVEYGCGSTDCSPCSLPNVDKLVCRDGQCAAGTCKAGFGACGESKEGCNADLASPLTCTNCLTACNVGAGQVCTPSGCGGDCGALTNCNGSCVNRQTSPNHCGTCGNVCPTQPNGDSICEAGACVVGCRQGFSHCDGNPAGPCTAQAILYQDADGDGFGNTAVTKQACSQQAAGAGWVATAGDCHDGNAAVNPGQAALFDTAYTSTGGTPSYDYDCNGVETENPGTPHFTPCGVACEGYGYTLNGSRSGAGVNNYCGSVTHRECAGGGGEIPILPQSFTPRDPQLLPVTGCYGISSAAPANGCR